ARPGCTDCMSNAGGCAAGGLVVAGPPPSRRRRGARVHRRAEGSQRPGPPLRADPNPLDLAVRGRVPALLLAVAFLTADAVFLLRNTSFSVGGSDSSGYLNTAKRLMEGTLVSRPRTLDRLGLPRSED